MNKNTKYLLLASAILAIVSCNGGGNTGGGIYAQSAKVKDPLSIIQSDDINFTPGADDIHSLVGDQGNGVTVGTIGYIVYAVKNNTPSRINNITPSSVNLLDGASWVIDKDIQPSCMTTNSLGAYATCYLIIVFQPKYQGFFGTLPVTVSYTYLTESSESSLLIPFRSKISYQSTVAAKAAKLTEFSDSYPGFTLTETTSVPANTKTYILRNNTAESLFAITMNPGINAESDDQSRSQFYAIKKPAYSETKISLDPITTSTCMQTYWYDQRLDPHYDERTARYRNVGIYAESAGDYMLYDRRVALQPGESCSIIVNKNAVESVPRLVVSAVVESGTSYQSTVVHPFP